MHQPVPSRRTATLENGTPRATAHTPWPAFIKLRRSGGSARAPHNNDGARALHRELRPVAFTIGYAVRAAPKRLNPSATNTPSLGRDPCRMLVSGSRRCDGEQHHRCRPVPALPQHKRNRDLERRSNKSRHWLPDSDHSVDAGSEERYLLGKS